MMKRLMAAKPSNSVIEPSKNSSATNTLPNKISGQADMYPFQNNGKRVSSTWVNPEMPEAVEATFWWLKGSRAFSKFWLNSKPLQAF